MSSLRLSGVVWVLLAALAGCGGSSTDNSGAADLAAEVRALARVADMQGDFSAFPMQRLPDADPLLKLGQLLFFSKSLSGHFDVACASCHHPDFAFADGLSLPVGAGVQAAHLLGPGRQLALASQDALEQQNYCVTALGYCGPNVPRNSQTVINTGLYQQGLFFDGRVEHLAIGGVRTPDSGSLADPAVGESLLLAQARFPVVSEEEMRGDGFDDLASDAYRAMLAERLRGDGGRITVDEANAWRARFAAAFGDDEQWASYDNIQVALAAYQESLTFVASPWQAFLSGAETLDAQALQGARLFLAGSDQGGLGCANCHRGDLFTDEKFHNVAFAQIGRGKKPDLSDRGRADVVLGDGNNGFAFRTPSLLNVAATAPYGHAGTFADLPSLLRYHSQPQPAQIESLFAHLPQFIADGATGLIDQLYADARMHTERARDADNFAAQALPMRDLTEQEVEALVAFLQSLTDTCVRQSGCLSQWMPDVSEDPDGNQLVRGVLDLYTDADPGGFHYPDMPVPLTALTASGLSTFAELQDSACETTVQGAGSIGFETVADDVSGLDLAHGLPVSHWFDGFYLVQTQAAMFSGSLTPVYLDDDCLIDLVYTAGAPHGLMFYFQQPDHSFVGQAHSGITGTGLPLGYAMTGIGRADINGDYRDELLLGNALIGADNSAQLLAERVSSASQFNVLILAADDTRLYEQAVPIMSLRNTFSVTAADVTGDGWPELMLAHWGAFDDDGGPVMFRHQGSSYQLADSDAGLTIEQGASRAFNFVPLVWDVDLDGAMDLTMVGDFGTSSVYRGDGMGRFTNVTDRRQISDENGMGAALGDFDNDGDLDWFVTSIFDQDAAEGSWGVSGNRLYRNDSTPGSIVLTDVSERAGVRDGAWGWGACFADFNNDGWLDIFHENGFGWIPDNIRTDANGAFIDSFRALAYQFLQSSPRLFINNADARDTGFAESASQWGVDVRSNGRGVACLDYDRDGDVDLLVFEHSARPRLYRNHSGAGSGRGFTSIRLVGTAPNTHAIGARVQLLADLNGDGVLEAGAGEQQLRVASANAQFAGQAPPDLHVGLGAASVIARLSISWPNGRELVCEQLAINQFLVFDQRQGDGAGQCPSD